MNIKQIVLAAANKIIVDINGVQTELVVVDCCHYGRHMQAVFSALKELGATITAVSDEDRGQGFIDESGHFLSRSDAFKVAKKSGQPVNLDFLLPHDKLDSSCIRHFDLDRPFKDYQ